MMNILAYADGKHDLIAIAERINVPAETCVPILETLHGEGLVERLEG
jgi:aminopeptidase-like protein